ncbi:Uncharacterised protein [Vibrio cholerae]|nr:Uncharacterised protein [Vibrio cholerae]
MVIGFFKREGGFEGRVLFTVEMKFKARFDFTLGIHIQKFCRDIAHFFRRFAARFDPRFTP